MNPTASWRIVVDDPGAHGATAPYLPAAASAPAQGAKASRADARRPPFEGIA